MENARLKEGARRGREIEPKEIAEVAGVSQSTVSQWLAGKKRPSLANALRVAPLLGTTAEWILLERGDRYAAPQSAEDAPGKAETLRPALDATVPLAHRPTEADRAAKRRRKSS